MSKALREQATAEADLLRFATELRRVLGGRAAPDGVGAIYGTNVVDAMFFCWAIRQAHPTKEAFQSFVRSELAGVIKPAQAWRMADTWAVARLSRPVRDLVAASPRRAMAFVRDFVDVAGGTPLLLDADNEIVKIIAAPKRCRREQLRGLIATKKDWKWNGKVGNSENKQPVSFSLSGSVLDAIGRLMKRNNLSQTRVVEKAVEWLEYSDPNLERYEKEAARRTRIAELRALAGESEKGGDADAARVIRAAADRLDGGAVMCAVCQARPCACSAGVSDVP